MRARQPGLEGLKPGPAHHYSYFGTENTNKDQDSWRGGTGDGDSKPLFDIFTGEPIPCRRSHLDCAGFYACEQVDSKFLNAQRYELDPRSLASIIEAQIHDRTKEADSAEKLVLT